MQIINVSQKALALKFFLKKIFNRFGIVIYLLIFLPNDFCIPLGEVLMDFSQQIFISFGKGNFYLLEKTYQIFNFHKYPAFDGCKFGEIDARRLNPSSESSVKRRYSGQVIK